MNEYIEKSVLCFISNFENKPVTIIFKTVMSDFTMLWYVRSTSLNELNSINVKSIFVLYNLK